MDSYDDALQLVESGNTADLEQLLSSQRFRSPKYAVHVDWHVHDSLETTSVAQTRCLLDNGARVAGLISYETTDGSPDGNGDPADHVPVAVQPLYCAALYGNLEKIKLLLQYGADPAACASDGTTPLYAACQFGHLPVVRLLHSLGVSLATANQDGTAQIHIAAKAGHLDVIKFLHAYACGVDLQVPGLPHILLDCERTHWTASGQSYFDFDFSKMRRNITPLTIAHECGHQELATFLEAATAAELPVVPKRERSEVPIHKRAAVLGVSHQLKPIPPGMLEATQTGTADARKAAKAALHKLQKLNQQIVSRAEQKQKRQKQMTLVCVRP